MIAIFSKSLFEETTDDVIDWLRHYNAKFVRLNGVDFVKAKSINDFSEKLIHSKACWFRRWIDDDFFTTLFSLEDIQGNNCFVVRNHVQREFSLLSADLWRRLRDKHWITKPSEVGLQKLNVLNVASTLGISVPPTLITTSKRILIEFKSQHGRIITKTIGDVPDFMSVESNHVMRTIEMTDEIIDQQPEIFFPSLFQRLIEKDLELRVFFLADQFYAMAIFSQRDSQTEIDFRNYNIHKPNRTVPIKLPETFVRQLNKLVTILGLTTGSIDLIKEHKTGNFFLLEINPVGQIGMTSYPCNYYLEREIAKHLIQHDK